MESFKHNKFNKRELKSSNILAPVAPALVSVADKEGKPNLITIAWIGTVNSEPPMLSISVQPRRFSHQILLDTQEFTVNLPTSQLAEAIDFCGVKSGREVDKFAACQLTPIKIPKINAPGVAESPVNIGCRIRQHLDLGSHTMFIAEIVSVLADENLFDNHNKLHLEKADIIAYMHGEYFPVGKGSPYQGNKLGFFGYSQAAPKVLARRLIRKRRKSKNNLR